MPKPTQPPAYPRESAGLSLGGVQGLLRPRPRSCWRRSILISLSQHKDFVLHPAQGSQRPQPKQGHPLPWERVPEYCPSHLAPKYSPVGHSYPASTLLQDSLPVSEDTCASMSLTSSIWGLPILPSSLQPSLGCPSPSDADGHWALVLSQPSLILSPWPCSAIPSCAPLRCPSASPKEEHWEV